MQPTSPKLLGAALSTLFAALLFSGVALAQTQDPAGQATPPAPQTTTQDPNAQPAPPQPAPPKAQDKKSQPGQDAPITSPDKVNPKNSKEDVEAIGNRGVGKGVNFYSLEKEIALGKGLAQEVERSSKLIDDPSSPNTSTAWDKTWFATPTQKFPSPLK